MFELGQIEIELLAFYQLELRTATNAYRHLCNNFRHLNFETMTVGRADFPSTLDFLYWRARLTKEIRLSRFKKIR